jgi:outer membrane biosynthesis protein TonB
MLTMNMQYLTKKRNCHEEKGRNCFCVWVNCNFMADMSEALSHFESEKNRKAALYTAAVFALLLFLFFFIRWSVPVLPMPVPEDGIEVNLGNSDEGLGDNQPQSPESPNELAAPVRNTAAAMPEPEASKEVETDDSEPDAPAVKSTPKPTPTSPKLAEKETSPKPIASKPTTAPIAPQPEKPKALFKGVSGNGPGGNEADDYKKGGNQGIAGGQGDQGKPGGNPNSNQYSGNGGTGKGGVAIKNGLEGRKISRFPSFEDEFNENAKIAVDIRVDAAGNVISATFQPKGSTTSDANMKAIALRKARQLKLSSGDAEAIGTIVFNFRLKN